MTDRLIDERDIDLLEGWLANRLRRREALKAMIHNVCSQRPSGHYVPGQGPLSLAEAQALVLEQESAGRHAVINEPFSPRRKNYSVRSAWLFPSEDAAWLWVNQAMGVAAVKTATPDQLVHGLAVLEAFHEEHRAKILSLVSGFIDMKSPEPHSSGPNRSQQQAVWRSLRISLNLPRDGASAGDPIRLDEAWDARGLDWFGGATVERELRANWNLSPTLQPAVREAMVASLNTDAHLASVAWNVRRASADYVPQPYRPHMSITMLPEDPDADIPTWYAEHGQSYVPVGPAV